MTKTFNKMLTHLEQQFLREQEFSSDAAHELRTPVSIILSHCEYSLAELEMSPEVRKEFLCIQDKALQMSPAGISPPEHCQGRKHRISSFL